VADDVGLVTDGVPGAGGVRLAVREAGTAGAPPVVLLHGWSASGAVWSSQLTDPELTEHHRLVAVDLRGHGDSAVPDPAGGGYADPAVWAGDVAAVLERTGPAVLVGWSYGGLVIMDYLAERGMDDVTGVVLVGALTEIGPGRHGGAIGPAWDGLMSPALSTDPAVAVPALTTLAGRMTAGPASGAHIQRLVADMVRVPPAVRAALFRRTLDNSDLLVRMTVPVLIVHGERDEVVSPRAAEYAAGKIPGASLRWFPTVGHMPFAEQAQEFNAVLRAFVGSASH
jgi:non-heme chloroperoxidase